MAESYFLNRFVNSPKRYAYALRYYLPKIAQVTKWTFQSREDTNYTYDLSDESLLYLAHTLAVVTGAPPETAKNYIDEARNDKELKSSVVSSVRASKFRFVSDERCDFGRRLGWYALVRLTKPKVVVETGIDKGLGAILLCAALLRNAKEGCPGHYYGTDINPEAGWLLVPPYQATGSILVGDSVASLAALDAKCDIFINDSDHSVEYERKEYEVILPKLSSNAIVLGDNAHVTCALADFASKNQMSFVYFHEVPRDHWYPGGGIGIAFRR